MQSSNQQFSLQLLVNKKPVTEYSYQGETLVEGRNKSEFTLQVRNGSLSRVAVVISVDGLSVMNGQPATKDSSGYVVEANQSLDILGWRLSDRQVAHFVFGSLPEAYASLMGHSDNIGVIGALFYHEKSQPLCPQPLYSLPPDLFPRPLIKGSGGSTRGGGAAGIGTGFGRSTDYRVSTVQFTRQPESVAQLTLRYDDATGLQSRGICLSTPHPPYDRVLCANAFPADRGCTPPPGWRA